MQKKCYLLQCIITTSVYSKILHTNKGTRMRLKNHNNYILPVVSVFSIFFSLDVTLLIIHKIKKAVFACLYDWYKTVAKVESLKNPNF